MHEDYLQQIWSQSRIPSPKLQLIDGTPIVIKNPGTHNISHSGPDFKEACVQFDNLEFHGAVEIHVNGSDWYKHKHHHDEAYNNVVLHVVYNNDMQIVQNGFSIPTLELKDFIDLDHFRKSVKVDQSNIDLPCKSSMDVVDPIFWSSMKTKALIQKLDEKVQPLIELDLEEALYRLIASVFGMGINKNAFLELAELLPWESLRKLPAQKRKQLILVMSGCAQGDYSKKITSEYQWHFKGTRPKNFPSARIPQFAEFISCIDLKKLIESAESNDLRDHINSYIDSINMRNGQYKLTKNMQNHLMINAIVPFLYLFSEQTKDERYLDKAIDLLSSLPSEKNSIIRNWKKNEVIAENAFDSQGLLALNRYYCSLKKCLSCEVGLKVLNRLE
ncbi:MAG: DUF2851 family protein [Crocinitomicaceae bacterium]|nr:DUF2851 family protein [Crocinitomicaceae bacterium]